MEIKSMVTLNKFLETAVNTSIDKPKEWVALNLY